MAANNIGQFRLNLRRYADNTKKDFDKFAVEFPQAVAREIVDNTPVKTGNLRRSWHWIRNGRTMSFVNATSYGIYVEFGTRFMQPRRFVGRAVDRAPVIAQEVWRRIRGS